MKMMHVHTMEKNSLTDLDNKHNHIGKTIYTRHLFAVIWMSLHCCWFQPADHSATVRELFFSDLNETDCFFLVPLYRLVSFIIYTYALLNVNFYYYFVSLCIFFFFIIVVVVVAQRSTLINVHCTAFCFST